MLPELPDFVFIALFIALGLAGAAGFGVSQWSTKRGKATVILSLLLLASVGLFTSLALALGQRGVGPAL